MTDREQELQAIYEEIREGICLLQYEPGQVLSENALANKYHISRGRMRRIFWRLEREGLLVISPGSGATVTAVDVKSLREVYAVRLKLIDLVGEQKPARDSNEVIARLQSLLEQAGKMDGQYDPSGLARIYNAFHHDMLEILRNRFLRQITDELYHQTSRVWLQLLPDLDWNEEVQLVCEEIHDVIEALQAEDMRKVAQTRRHHMSLLLHRINDYLRSADEV